MGPLRRGSEVSRQNDKTSVKISSTNKAFSTLNTQKARSVSLRAFCVALGI